MGSVKKLLYNVIESMDDEEANQILKIAQSLQKKRVISITISHLASDPSFKVHSEVYEEFRLVKPIKGKGIPASQLLMEDRR